MSKYTAQEIDELIEKAAERAVEKAVKRSAKHTDAAIEHAAKRTDMAIEASIQKAAKHTNEVVNTAIERAAKNTDEVIEAAIERVVGAYSEDTKHHIGLVLESTDFIKQKLEDMVTRDEFNELKDEVKLIRAVTTETNRNLKKLAKRTTGLEETVYHD